MNHEKLTDYLAEDKSTVKTIVGHDAGHVVSTRSDVETISLACVRELISLRRMMGVQPITPTQDEVYIRSTRAFYSCAPNMHTHTLHRELSDSPTREVKRLASSLKLTSVTMPAAIAKTITSPVIDTVLETMDQLSNEHHIQLETVRSTSLSRYRSVIEELAHKVDANFILTDKVGLSVLTDSFRFNPIGGTRKTRIQPRGNINMGPTGTFAVYVDTASENCANVQFIFGNKGSDDYDVGIVFAPQNLFTFGSDDLYSTTTTRFGILSNNDGGYFSKLSIGNIET